MTQPSDENRTEELHGKKEFKNVGEAIPLFGGFGRFQQLLTACFSIMIMPATYCTLIMYFAAINPDWKCSANSSTCMGNGTFTNDNRARCVMDRSDWEFTEPSGFSIVTTFDIYCDNEWMIYLTSSILFIGWGIGAVFLGWISDNYGRKVVIFPSFFMILTVGFIASFSPGITFLVIIRFILGFFVPGTGVQMVVLLSEYVSTKYRPHAITVVWIFFTIALCLLPLKAYFIQDWKILFIACSIPYIFILAFYKFIPESVRWLHLHKGVDEVMEIFKRIRYWNKEKHVGDFNILPMQRSSTKHGSNPLELFRTRRMAIKTLVQGYTWMVNGMVYYGLSMAADDLGGSLYTNFALLSLIEFPANIISIFMCDKIGRRKTTSISMILGGVSCVLVAFIPSTGGIKIFRIVLGTFGKFCITISFNAIYTWSLEIFSTNIRAEGMGFLQITSRIGSASSTWIAKGLKTLHRVAPFLVMGSLSVVAAVMCLLLPETKGIPIKDIDEDEENENCQLIGSTS